MSVGKCVGTLLSLALVTTSTGRAQARPQWQFFLRDTQQVTKDSASARALRYGGDTVSIRVSPSLMWVSGLNDSLFNALGDSLDAGRFAPYVKRYAPVQMRMVRDQPPRLTGALLDVQSWGLASIHAPEAWAKGARGCGVIGAHVDTGFGPNPQATVAGWYRQLVWTGAYPNQVQIPDTSLATNLYDQNGHGTHTGGTMVGNDVSGVGVAPCAQLWVFKADSPTCVGCIFSSAMFLAGDEIKNAPATFPLPVAATNMSIGFNGPSRVPPDGLATEILDGGAVPCAAAGNNGDAAGLWPGNTAPFVGVSAIGGDNNRTGWSSYGANVSFAMPGEGINSLCAGGGGAGCTMSGTSMASPHCAGSALLVRSVRQDYTAQQVIGLLCRTADLLGAPSDPGMPAHDDFYGCGRINLGRAVDSMLRDPYTATVDSGQRVATDLVWHCEAVGGTGLFKTFSEQAWVAVRDSVVQRKTCYQVLPTAPIGGVAHFQVTTH